MLSVRSVAQMRSELERVGTRDSVAERLALRVPALPVRLEAVPASVALSLKDAVEALGATLAGPPDLGQRRDAAAPCVLLCTLDQYDRLRRGAAAQGGELANLADEIAVTLERYQGASPPLVCHDREIVVGQRTLVMGIINVTRDSFSGDGLADQAEVAVRQAVAFARDGADILDVGGESTRPGAEPIGEEEEAARVLPLLQRILAETDLPVSVDTSKPMVARAALDAGAHIVNDVRGLREEGMVEVVAQCGAPAVIMHMQGTPRDMQVAPRYDDLMTEIYGFLCARVEAAVAGGIAEEQLVVDPGFGFGKRVVDNLELTRRLSELRSLGRPVLLGPSRKASIGRVLGREVGERQWGTAAVVAAAILNGADIVRVHDVAQMTQVARMTDAIRNGWDESADA